jgi:hypothetical protein
MDVLPAQASSVSSERVFSSSKITCTRARNKISARTIEQLQLLKYYIRHHRAPINDPDESPMICNNLVAETEYPGKNSQPPVIHQTLDMMTRLSESDWNDEAILEFDAY